MKRAALSRSAKSRPGDPSSNVDPDCPEDSGGEGFVRERLRPSATGRYDPPAKGPISFTVTFTFKPGAEATSTQLAPCRAPPPPPPPAAPLPAGTVRVGGQSRHPCRCIKVAPIYPADRTVCARAGHRHSRGVDRRRRPGERTRKVLRSVPLLDQAALDAVRTVGVQRRRC